MKKISLFLVVLGILACGPMSGGTVLDNSSFMRKLNSCYDSYSCKELHSQSVIVLTDGKCDKPATISCAEARRNSDLSFEKYSQLQLAETESSETIRKISEADRQAKVQALLDAQRNKDLATQKQCQDTEDQRHKAMVEYKALADVKRANAAWVATNCTKKVTSQTICTKGNRNCEIVDGVAILNCGSNKRPTKFDGTRLSDTDILENHVGTSAEDEQKIVNDNFAAQADQRVCDEAEVRLRK